MRKGKNLDIVCPLHTVSDVPATVENLLVGRNVVPDQTEDLHHHVLRDRDTVAVGHLLEPHRESDQNKHWEYNKTEKRPPHI